MEKYAPYVSNFAMFVSKPQASVLWRGLTCSRDLFQRSSHMEVGNGHLIKFLE